STAARLTVHYWDVSDGSITIGGRDIREYTFDTLMSMTAYVAQDNFLFRGTIADNLRMGKKDATMDEMIAAAKAAACHDFITKLPHGYDTEVGVLG
ncbi:ABC transporter ATP-binding protein/permease, partial [Lacrimispora saccharolytica]|nr:ABC transporter ATP-binding protein/permease [Lacrimispora saccharolytica]